MRIQHNIPALNAYRNYNNNTSALSKNLEKLSSGYKINRAGDDAAGLAISEKMRAQITGLNAAQKNVKDGVSLVKTAEGAMQEIHDMLNRMDYLATQSANGTYDNEVDRANLQKEVNALKSEINRIADSANFNGIKLLDGSLSKDGIASISSKFDLPDVGLILGKDTVLHRDEDEGAASTAFGLELHNVKFTGKANDQFTIDIGGTKLIGTLVNDMDGSDLEHTLKGEDMVAGLLGDDDTKVTFADENGNAIDPNKITIGGKEYNMSAGVTKPSGPTEGTGILFQLNDPETDVEVSFDVKVYAGTDPDAAAGTGEATTGAITGTATTDAVVIPAVGGMTGTGKTNASSTVSEHKSSGIVDRTKFNFTKKNGITTNTANKNLGVVFGNDFTFSFDGAAGNNKYEITLDAGQLQSMLNAKEGATAGTITADDISLGVNGNNLELKLGTTVLGTAAINALTDGTAANIDITVGADTFTCGTIKASTGNGTYAAGEVLADVTAALTGKSTGLSTAKISSKALTADQQEAFTKAAVAVGAGSGHVMISYDANAEAGKRVQLMIGDKVIGTADENQLNKTSTLSFKSADGADIATIDLAGNGELTGAKLAGLTFDTGVEYADARVGISSVGTVDHDALATAVKELVTDAGKDIGDGTLDVTFDGTNLKLMLGDTEIATGALATGKITFTGSDAAGSALFDITLSNAPAALTDLFGDSTTIFKDIGPTISISDVTKKATDTTGLTADMDTLSAAVNEAAKAAGVTLADGTELTISYNPDAVAGKEYELKAGDVVVATATDPGAPTTGTIQLSFATDGGTNLGTVDINGLKGDFKAADLKGEIATGITFDADKTPATTASFTLDNDKLKEFAEANGVTAGQNVVAKYDDTGTWALYFSDGTTDTKIADGTLSADKKTVTFGDFGSAALSGAFDDTAVTAASDAIDTGLKYGETSFKSGITGDFLVTTSDQQNTSQTAGDRLASTVLDLTSDMITDGASIFVAGQNYTFSTGEGTVMPKGAVKVDISDLDAEKLGDKYISAVAKRLTDAYAADNTGVYTLGWNGKNITVTETKTHGNLNSDGSNDDTYPKNDKWDLRTMEGIAKSLGYSSAATNGKALTLQIGDTSDKFNQMEVSVGDMHTTAMGLEDGDKISDIDISTQDGAAKAVDVIKGAINYVSSVRGDLGAIQNRLEHTQNNLSVMAENIQDAESTIRDTDVAEEMMSYVKNNILVQSAQAMLAQANQLPQGVLQLLG